MKEISLESTAAEVYATIVVRPTVDDIDCIMSSALDAIGYWCKEAKVDGDYLGEYASEQIARGGRLMLQDAEENASYMLDLEKLAQGLRIWLEKGYDHYGAVSADGKVDTCKIDGDAADSIMQLALFGEIVFS